jgi:NAD(P)-dependent dehydrogenase (short-subunit alcohol dehydrogenase family)
MAEPELRAKEIELTKNSKKAPCFSKVMNLRAPNSTAKGGMITMTKELAPHGIRVNAASPGVIDTPFHEQFSTPEAIRNSSTTFRWGASALRKRSRGRFSFSPPRRPAIWSAKR